ncbi:uncharacterized protein DEA37_0012466 [Paragonimus westermani]|uniref:PHD-type domain-containing protein n=2 Tax=Paragonimus westermani TaxID=34504 RepID=A0A5J4N595_9TREM|nr:uncharacterized protein DEA37_0012466 [Paragonimus westermani]
MSRNELAGGRAIQYKNWGEGMPRRKSRVVVPPGSCALCHKTENHPLLGDLLEKNDLKFHSNCIFASSGLYQEKTDGRTNREYIEGFHIEAIQREIRRGKSLLCAQCHSPGACVGCVVVSCPSSFHLPCLTKAGGITIFEGPFPSYCKRHAPKQVSLFVAQGFPVYKM